MDGFSSNIKSVKHAQNLGFLLLKKFLEKKLLNECKEINRNRFKTGHNAHFCIILKYMFWRVQVGEREY